MDVEVDEVVEVAVVEVLEVDVVEVVVDEVSDPALLPPPSAAITFPEVDTLALTDPSSLTMPPWEGVL